jgi:hypothetical protein
MTWLPWLLLFALGAGAVWGFATVAAHVRWARRTLLAADAGPRPQGWLVRRLRLEELFIAIEGRAENEGEIRAAAGRRKKGLNCIFAKLSGKALQQAASQSGLPEKIAPNAA